MATTDDEACKPLSRRMLCEDVSDCPNGNEHRLTIWATYTAADGLTIEQSDSASWPCEDLEYTYHIAPEHIGGLRAALGAVGSDDLLERFAQHYVDGTVSTLSLVSWLETHGVAYSASQERYPN